MPPFRVYYQPLLSSMFFYFTAQAALFIALRRSDASRVSPLLALKVVFLALISVIFMHEVLGLQQWVAILLCLAAAVTLNFTGGQLPWMTAAMVILACLGYSLSDLNIKLLVDALAGSLKQQDAIYFGVCACYLCCGVVALPMLLWQRQGIWRDLPYAIPFSLAWLAAMVFLFTCFATVGVIYGNILQSTRGILSIGMGVILAKMNLEHLEQRVSISVTLRRVLAAGMMGAAIYLYFGEKLF
jgi:drug/metabolite transporter (DMT)-like permease